MAGLIKVSMKTETLQVNESKRIKWVAARSPDKRPGFSKTNKTSIDFIAPATSFRQTKTEVVFA